MATTRELVSFILERDPSVRKWFEQHHNFTLKKAQKADLTQYRELTAAVIREGLNHEIVTREMVEGQARPE